MTLASDPRYIALAKEAALVLGSKDSDIVAAILAQWTCEKGNHDEYPPVRNNPGNLARGAAAGLGFTFTVQYPNPQPGNPIVTFWSPAGGAGAYATLIKNGSRFPWSRYAGVMRAVRAGDGHAFIVAMGKSGYGTSTACMLSAYHPSAPPTDTPTPVREPVLNLVPGIAYKTVVLVKPNQKVLGSPGGKVIYITKAGERFPEVGDYLADGGDYHVMRMPGDIAGYLAHGGTLGTAPA